MLLIVLSEISATYLHANIGITHTTIDGEFRQCVSAIHLHGIEDCLSLEAGSFHGGTSNVSTLRVLSYSD